MLCSLCSECKLWIILLYFLYFLILNFLVGILLSKPNSNEIHLSEMISGLLSVASLQLLQSLFLLLEFSLDFTSITSLARNTYLTTTY